MLQLKKIRTLTLAQPTQVGRPGHIAAASGLLRIPPYFYVVADDEVSLAVFGSDSQPARLIPLLPTALPLPKDQRKKAKPDFESLVEINGGILAVPSGSEPQRGRGVFYADEKSEVIDFSPLYRQLSRIYTELNIEGAVLRGSQLILLQRGNGVSHQNALIFLDRETVQQDMETRKVFSASSLQASVVVDLGRINGVPVSFTDAALGPGGRIWFLAVAENVESTYLDGEFEGAILGCVDEHNKVIFREALAITAKPEGLCVDADGHSFYVVTDADDSEQPAHLFQGSLPSRF